MMHVGDGVALLESLVAAVNAHDLDALVDHFSEDVRSETPAHPARSFVGRGQVRSNWSTILGSVADLRATLVSAIASPPGSTPRTVWAELAFDGTRPDGAVWRMRGVTVNEIRDGRIASLRFYLEAIDETSLAASAAARSLVGATGGPADRS